MKVRKTAFVKFLAAESAVLALFVLVVLLRNGLPSSWGEIVAKAAKLLSAVILTGVCAAFLIALLAFIAKHIPFDQIETSIKLCANRMTAKRRERNVNQIAPYLQNFLFCTIKRNNELLQLPLGETPACLTPFGFAPVFRAGRVFYPFQLVATEMPTMPEEQLKKLLDQFIMAELNNFGIPGLYCSYRYGAGLYHSVYVDRVSYDSANNIITFELLFLGCDGDAEYLLKALSRDNAPSVQEPEVFDDEI